MSPASSDRRAKPLALAIFILALAIRLLGITWGLPNDLRNQSLHPDEMVVYTNYAYQPNAWLPGNYNYPSLYPLVLRVAGDMIATYGHLDSPVGAPQATSMEGLQATLTKHSPHMRAVNLMGRVLSSLAGAGTAAVVFLLLAQFNGLRAGLLGGLLTAIAPSFVLHSRFQTVDVAATFFLWLAMLYAVRLHDAPAETSKRSALLAGVFAGLSAGTKYTGAIVLLSVLAAILLRKDPSRWKLLAISVAACLAVFLVSTPGAIFDTQGFLFGISQESAHMREGHELTFVSTPSGFLFQLGNLFTGIGPLAMLLGVAGLAHGAARKVRWTWVMLPTVLAYFVVIGAAEVKFVRYGLPLVPAVACGFGYAVAGLMRRPRLKPASYAVAAVALLGLESALLSGTRPSGALQYWDPRFGGLWGTGRYTAWMLREDPRDAAARYLKERPNATVGLFQTPWFWTVPVIRDAEFLYNVPTDKNGPVTAAYLATTSAPHVVLAQETPDFIALTSLETAPFERVHAREDVPELWLPLYDAFRPVYDQIQIVYEPDRTFGDEAPAVEDLQYVQPKVQILRRRGAA